MSRLARRLQTRTGRPEGCVLINIVLCRSRQPRANFIGKGAQRKIAFLLVAHHLFKRRRHCRALRSESPCPTFSVRKR